MPKDQTRGPADRAEPYERGRMLGQVKMQQPLVGGTLARPRVGWVSTGETNGRFSGFDASTGEALWTNHTGGNIGAPPISYVVNGRQFVAAAVAPASAAGSAPSGTIRAFALP